jgi:hypothetical protein
MRQKIDPYHASNLRSARPQATINDEASASRLLPRTRSASSMLANGLAMIVLICVREATTSSTPGNDCAATGEDDVVDLVELRRSEEELQGTRQFQSQRLKKWPQ